MLIYIAKLDWQQWENSGQNTFNPHKEGIQHRPYLPVLLYSCAFKIILMGPHKVPIFKAFVSLVI